MKLSFFETLDSVLRTGSLAGAARERHVTPSAVSMQMKQMEAYFGQPLFDRAGLTVRPTPLAREIADVMGDAMRRIETLRQRTNSQVEGVMRLGVMESMQSTLLPGAVAYLRSRHPAVRVRPVRGRSVELVDAVKAGKLDAAVVMHPSSGGSQRLAWHPLLRRELVLLAPPQEAEGRPATLFKDHEWIRFDPDTSIGRMAARWVRKHAPGARAAMELQSVQTVVAMVSAGLGVSIVMQPDDSMTMAHPVRVLRLGRGAPTVQVSLVSRPSDAESRKLEVLRDALASVAGELRGVPGR
jgi:DNA-binding transcriptional LysR family regulator